MEIGPAWGGGSFFRTGDRKTISRTKKIGVFILSQALVINSQTPDERDRSPRAAVDARLDMIHSATVFVSVLLAVSFGCQTSLCLRLSLSDLLGATKTLASKFGSTSITLVGEEIGAEEDLVRSLSEPSPQFSVRHVQEASEVEPDPGDPSEVFVLLETSVRSPSGLSALLNVSRSFSRHHWILREEDFSENEASFSLRLDSSVYVLGRRNASSSSSPADDTVVVFEAYAIKGQVWNRGKTIRKKWGIMDSGK